MDAKWNDKIKLNPIQRSGSKWDANLKLMTGNYEAVVVLEEVLKTLPR